MRFCALLTLLYLLQACLCQFGCQLTQSNCTSHGICQSNGLCSCFLGYDGENCELTLTYKVATPTLNKTMIGFWIVFWILLTFIPAFLLYVAGVYCNTKDCSEVKDKFKVVGAIFCCLPYSPTSSKRLGQPKTSQPTHPEDGLLSDRASSQGETNVVSMLPGKPGIERVKLDEELPEKTLKKDFKKAENSSFRVSLVGNNMLHAEKLIKAQQVSLQKTNIRKVTDSLSNFKQMYPWDDFEEYDEENLEREIVSEEENLSGAEKQPSYSDLLNRLYKD